MDGDAAIAQCREQVAAPGTDLYYASLYLTPEERSRLHSLHALASELGAIPLAVSDAGVARTKLAWWDEELAHLAEGLGRHPISLALAASGAIERVDLSALRSLPMTCASWLDRPPLPTMEAVADTHLCFEGVLWRETTRALGTEDTITLTAAQWLGVAIGVVTTLRELRALAHAGIARLPGDQLLAQGLNISTLLDSPKPEAIAAIATHMAGYARAAVLQALTVLSNADRPALLPALVMTEIAVKTLAEMQTDGFRLLERRVTLTPLRKLWIAFTIRRRERLRQRRSPRPG